MTVHRCKWSVVYGVFMTVHSLFGRAQTMCLLQALCRLPFELNIISRLTIIRTCVNEQTHSGCVRTSCTCAVV